MYIYNKRNINFKYFIVKFKYLISSKKIIKRTVINLVILLCKLYKIKLFLCFLLNIKLFIIKNIDIR